MGVEHLTFPAAEPALQERVRLPPGPGQVFHYQPRGRLHPRHAHREIELNLVVAGQARWLVQDQCHRIARGSLVWLLPGHEHLLVDLSPDFAMWIAVVRPGPLRRWCGSASHPLLTARLPDGISRSLTRADASRLEVLFAELSRPRTRAAAARFAHGLAYALLLAWEAFQSGQHQVRAAVHPAVEAALARLRHQDMPLDALAGSVALSTSRLRHLVRASVGASLLQLRNRFRVERFLLLAADPRRRLDACAEAAGFGTYVQCHRVVRQLLGVSPSSWRAAQPGGQNTSGPSSFRSPGR